MKEVYQHQYWRSLVERIIRRCNEWKVLKGFDAGDVAEFESWLDFVIAMVNLKTLADAGRLGDIPADVPRGAEFRNFSKSVLPELKAVKYADELPYHFQQLENEGPNFVSRDWAASFRPTIKKRSESRVLSAYVLQIMTCELPGGRLLLAAWCGASARGLSYLCGVLMDKQNFFLETACGCTLGKGSIEDEDSNMEGGRRHEEEKNGCSHIGSLLELWTRYLSDPVSFHLVVRKSKTVKLDDQLRHVPLEHALKLLKEAQTRLYLQSVPYSQPQPVKICVCGRAEDAVPSAKVVECATCEERYHNTCIKLSKKDAEQLGDDWDCGFCLGDEESAFRGHSGSDDDYNDWGSHDEEWTQRWVLWEKKLNKRGKSHAGASDSLIYERSSLNTPAYYRRKHIAQQREFIGPSSWDEFVDLVEKNASQCRSKIEALNKQAAAALKEAGHHVGDAQGADGLERAHLNDGLLDVLADDGLLLEDNVEEEEDE